MTASAHDIAAEFRRRLPGVGKKKLHKLLYYAHGHHLADLGTPRFSENVRAWRMGPVVGTACGRKRTAANPLPNRTN